VQGNGQSTRLTFLKTDPLPVISVRVNGGDTVAFFVDTGGSEVALDTDFARELGVPQFGAVQGTFAGGQHAEVQNGRIESLTVGDWTIKNLPVAMLALRQLPKVWRETSTASSGPICCTISLRPRLSARQLCCAGKLRKAWQFAQRHR
jgi:hypothetical protein